MKDNRSINDIIGPQPRKAWVVIATIGLLLVAVGTVMPILSSRQSAFDMIAPTFKYIYSAGALMLLVSRLMTPYKGSSTRVRRLYRLESWSALFFCVGAFFLFYSPTTVRDWLAFTLAGAAIQIYSSIMVPRTIKKEINALDDK